ncbi:MAG: nucleotidyltransferase family protein [Anaerolineae bacterium]
MTVIVNSQELQKRIKLSSSSLAEFCRRWQIKELALFGSVLRDDFSDDSDVDMLVSFLPDAGWSLLDAIQLELELAAMLGRDVDLISKPAVEKSPNWIRRRQILDTAQVIYAA